MAEDIPCFETALQTFMFLWHFVVMWDRVQNTHDWNGYVSTIKFLYLVQKFRLCSCWHLLLRCIILFWARTHSVDVIRSMLRKDLPSSMTRILLIKVKFRILPFTIAKLAIDLCDGWHSENREYSQQRERWYFNHLLKIPKCWTFVWSS